MEMTGKEKEEWKRMCEFETEQEYGYPDGYPEEV